MSDSIPLGIVMATRLEALPFIKGDFSRLIHKEPFPLYVGDKGCCIISGIGKAAAAMAAVYLIEKFHPAFLLNFGAAGALRDDLHVGDIFQVLRVWEHDRPGLMSGEKRIYEAEKRGDLPGMVLATGDMPVLDARQREILSRDADLVDMEGAGLMQGAGRYGLPVSLYKIVTDTPEHETDREIIENVKNTRQALYAWYRDSLRPLLV